LAVLDIVLCLVGAVRKLTAVKWLAQRAGCGVDAGDDDGGRGAKPRPKWDLAVDGNIEAGGRRVGGLPAST